MLYTSHADRPMPMSGIVRSIRQNNGLFITIRGGFIATKIVTLFSHNCNNASDTFDTYLKPLADDIYRISGQTEVRHYFCIS